MHPVDQRMILYKQLLPACWNFHIDKERFLKIRGFEDLFQQHGDLILRARNYSAPSNGWVFEAIDPNSHDLKKCDYIFFRVVHGRKLCDLEQFAKPTFCGWQAFALARKIYELSGAHKMYFGDSTTLLSCCTDKAPVSMRTFSILTTGRGWYQNQGAKPTSFGNVYLRLIKNNYSAALESKEIPGNPFDYHKYLHQRLKIFNMCANTPEAYVAACGFISTLTIAQFPTYLQSITFETARDQLKWTSSHLSPSSTVGELIQAIKPVNHALYHELLDTVVSNRDNNFFRYLQLSLKPGTFSLIKAAFAYTVFLTLSDLKFASLDKIAELEEKINKKSSLLNHLRQGSKKTRTSRNVQLSAHEKQLEELKIALKAQQAVADHGTIAYHILFHPELISPMRPIFDDYLSKYVSTILDKSEKINEPYYQKIFQNTTEEQRIKWKQFMHQQGINNFMDVLKPVVEWFGAITINHFVLVNNSQIPYFHKDLASMILTEFKENPSCTMKEFIRKVETAQYKEYAFYALSMFIYAAGPALSSSTIPLFTSFKENPNTFSKQEVYELWMLAKTIIQEFTSFEV